MNDPDDHSEGWASSAWTHMIMTKLYGYNTMTMAEYLAKVYIERIQG